MGLITKRLRVHGPRRRSRRVEALFDSGSTVSFIRESIARSLGSTVELAEPETYEMLRGSVTVREAFVSSVTIAGHHLAGLFRVLDGLSEELLIGADFLQLWHIRLEPRRRRVILDPKALRLRAGGGRLRVR